jgi:NitT/TauT family transport system ATP-binding protein
MTAPLRLIIHAPTAAALARARRNAANLLNACPDAQVRIVANGEAVAAALDSPDAETDGLLALCGNTLAKLGRIAGALTVVPAAVVAIAEAQAGGWAYMRA